MRGSRLGSPYTVLVAAVIALLIGFFLRTFGLDWSSLWLDEVYSYRRASLDSWSELHSILRDKNHAPLYSAALLRLWMTLGHGEFVLRFLTAAMGVLNISIVARLGRDLFDTKVGFLSALLLGASPLHIRYSREVRMYVPAALFASLAIYFLCRALRSGGWRNWVGYVLGAALSLYTHYYSAFTLLSLSALVLARAWLEKDWELGRSLLVSNAVVGLLFAPWLPTFWVQLRSDPVSWIEPLTWSSFHTTFTRFFVQRGVLGQLYPFFASLLALVGLAGAVLMIIRRNEARADWRSYLFAASAFLGPILLALAVSLMKPFIVDRYFVITVVPASVVLSESLVLLSRQRWGLIISGVIMVGVMVSAFNTGTTQWREDWRVAAAYVSEHGKAGDVVVLGSHLHLPPFNHYYHGSIPVYSLPNDPSCTEKESCRATVRRAVDRLDPKRLWVVRTERFHGDTRLEDYVGEDYLERRVSCRAFGGHREANVCLYDVRQPE